jgi:hypothetical protein
LKLKENTNPKKLEELSSAFTLSDMEIFIFPNLIYSLVLANILSPAIWEWRKDPWFKNMGKRNFNQKVNRIKQYIMDNYAFNLDLDTWGLTTKEREIDRFSPWIDPETLSRSNALFGYEGDKYYFSIDIRKHFGLDKYNNSIIPYWKTETVEAMNAFRYKKEYKSGAGECVSLAALYAAALFVVGKIPLEEIFLIATPLHSQNFIAHKQGIITNNRRIVTKNMWFNGTALSAKARRALENEKVTIVSHVTGYIHTLYPEASINPEAYQKFSRSLREFLSAPVEPRMLANYLRQDDEFQACFQFEWDLNGKKRYIPLEKIYAYEHTSSNNFSTDSRMALLKEIDPEEFHNSKLDRRIVLNRLEEQMQSGEKFSLKHFNEAVCSEDCFKDCPEMGRMVEGFNQFIRTNPQLPDEKKKTFIVNSVPDISIDQSREEILELIRSSADTDPMAELALYAYRDAEFIDWRPMLKAVVERNPVCLEVFKGLPLSECYEKLNGMENRSIYPDKRLALPDEVVNFSRGDGVEKALCLLNVIKNRHPEKTVPLQVSKRDVKVIFEGMEFGFDSEKGIQKAAEY